MVSMIKTTPAVSLRKGPRPSYPGSTVTVDPAEVTARETH